MWIYQQSTGILKRDNEEIARGYSGHGAGRNSPEYEKIPDVGPLPAGRWFVGPAFAHPSKGPVCMALSPVGHDAHGRTGFLIHGDNKAMDGSASHGCIILPRAIRAAISISGDCDLAVEA